MVLTRDASLEEFPFGFLSFPVQPEDPRKDLLGVAVVQQGHCCYKGQRLAGLQHCTETSHIHLVEVSVMANRGPVLLFAFLDAHEG
jgi:hypothetical protein